MVQFHMRNRIGKSGERVVETFIEDNLHFIYRRIDHPDIGIDGEIEITNKDGTSTGGLLKIQVKTTEEKIPQRIRVPIDERHLDYFATLTVPPILAVVSQPDGRIWWKPILQKENHRGPKGGFSIHLDRDKDLMSPFSGRLLSMIGQRSNAMIAKYLIEEAEERLVEIDDDEAGNKWDLETVEGWSQRIPSIKNMLLDARCLLRYERRYSDTITSVEEEYARVVEKLRSRKEWFSDNGVSDVLNYDWGDGDGL